MKILVISDGHGDIDNLKIAADAAKDAGMVIFAGDFAAFKKPETGLPFLKELLKIHDNIYAVLGNCDPPEFSAELDRCGISLEKKLIRFGGFMFAGSGGGSKFTGATPNERTEEELVSDLKIVEEMDIEQKNMNNLIVVAHNPPHGTKLDKVAPLIHVGSKLIREFIEKHKPVLAVSGHIHESYAVDMLNGTLLVNPGALCEKRYAVVEITGGEGNYKASAELKYF